MVASYYWNNPEIKDPAGIALQLRDKYNSELVQLKALKINIDGGEAQHTAVMLKPYSDRPGFHGEFLLDPKLVEAAVLKAQERTGYPLPLLRGRRNCSYLDIVAKPRSNIPTVPRGTPSRTAADHRPGRTTLQRTERHYADIAAVDHPRSV